MSNLKGWDKVIGDFNKKDPFFKKIVNSQKAYAKESYEVLIDESAKLQAGL